MSTTIAPEALAEQEGRTVIDVRTPEEYAEAHLPGSIDVPLERLGQMLDELPQADELVLICASGRRSAEGAALLRERGIPAVSVEGGLQAWRAAGLPVEEGAPGA